MTTKVLPGMAKGLNQNTCTQHIQMRVYIPYPAGYASITYLHSVKVLTYMFQHVLNPNMIYVHSIPHIYLYFSSPSHNGTTTLTQFKLQGARSA